MPKSRRCGKRAKPRPSGLEASVLCRLLLTWMLAKLIANVTGDTGVLKEPATLAVTLMPTVAMDTSASIGSMVGRVSNTAWSGRIKSAAFTSISVAMMMSAALVVASRRESGSFATPVKVGRIHLIRVIFDVVLLFRDLSIITFS
jgi:hypothetical protein